MGGGLAGSIPLLLGIFLRIGISLGPHSGQGKPPMFGDYEAQRHWQEVTVNLPMDQWYVNGTDNNLLYWGLDYPPLTAYHSHLMGRIANFFNSSWITLHTSRGTEEYTHRIFMRMSVLVAEAVYLTPLLFLSNRITAQHSGTTAKVAHLLLVVLAPGQALIDHGHFQYNNISLGLTLCAVALLLSQSIYWGSVMFALALNYKQMSLYHALPFFFYLFAPRYNTLAGLKQVVKLGIVVIATFVLCWIPMYTTIPDVIIRLFPFNRGLFEDKVANFWCSLSLIIKIQNHVSTVTLVRLALFATLLAVLPSQFHLCRYPTPDRFILALTNSAMGFFLFSFHVHEKTILIPGVTTLLLFSESPVVVTWFQVISSFSMYPLLHKDGQSVMYLGSMGLYLVLALVVLRNRLLHQDRNYTHKLDWALRHVFVGSVLGCVLLHLGEMLIEPPIRYPYLFPTLNAAYSALHFGFFFCYFHYLQYTGLPELFRRRTKVE